VKSDSAAFGVTTPRRRRAGVAPIEAPFPGAILALVIITAVGDLDSGPWTIGQSPISALHERL
jgi:hypothetical protein